MSSVPRGLETKPVFDWNRQPLGTVLGSEVDPRTHDATSLIIGLTEDAQEQMGTDQSTISIPFDLVFGIRRDEVRLNRDIGSLLPSLVRSEAEQHEPTVLEVPATR